MVWDERMHEGGRLQDIWTNSLGEEVCIVCFRGQKRRKTLTRTRLCDSRPLLTYIPYLVRIRRKPVTIYGRASIGISRGEWKGQVASFISDARTWIDCESTPLVNYPNLP